MGRIVPYTRGDTLSDAEIQYLQRYALSVKAASLIASAGTTAPLSYMDATGWGAATLSVTYNVKQLLNVNDATVINWRFLDADDNYTEKGGTITHASPDEVTVSFEIPPGASTYQLVGSR